MKEAVYYETLDDGKVHCLLCPQDCVIAEGRSGFCRVRVNSEGRLYTLNYERVAASGLDPIEKKPLYHFHPGSTIYSVGTMGCNQRCDFCQNWQLLEPGAPTRDMTCAGAVREAKNHGSIGIAYTYNEPTIWYEFVMECSKLAKEAGLANVLVTNGLINRDPFHEMAPLVDAMNVDVKSMEPKFYREICKSDLEPVLDTCRAAREAGIHLEVTNLVIPTLNDSEELVSSLVDFVYRLGPEVPLHISGYFPSYKMTIEPTPLSTLERAREIAREKLYYVYLGNVTTLEGADTRCPRCDNELIRRDRTGVDISGIENGSCKRCGRKADVVL